MPVTLDDVLQARQRIAGGVFATPCFESPNLSALLGMKVYTKLELMQRTGSFKERGARNALLQLSPEQKQRGVIAASAGNHALGLAYHGHNLGIPVTVVMPQFAPLVKAETCRRYGARVLRHGDHLLEAKQHAETLQAEGGLTYIHGFDDPAIIAGQGTVALEILEQVPDLEAVIIPVGGAGLLAGMALVFKELAPEVEIIGVEPERCPSFAKALEAGHPVSVVSQPSLADGLAVTQVGANAFALAKPRLDRLVLVNEEELALAIVELLRTDRVVAEGSGASPLAACLHQKLPHLAGKKVVLTLCGGNIDLTVLDRIIESGLVAAHQLHRFRAVISDRPGGLARLATVISQAGASIQEVVHDRLFGGADVAVVSVQCVIQTRDAAHIAQVRQALAAAGIRLLEDLDRPPALP